VFVLGLDEVGPQYVDLVLQVVGSARVDEFVDGLNVGQDFR